MFALDALVPVDALLPAAAHFQPKTDLDALPDMAYFQPIVPAPPSPRKRIEAQRWASAQELAKRTAATKFMLPDGIGSEALHTELLVVPFGSHATVPGEKGIMGNTTSRKFGGIMVTIHELKMPHRVSAYEDSVGRPSETTLLAFADLPIQNGWQPPAGRVFKNGVQVLDAPKGPWKMSHHLVHSKWTDGEGARLLPDVPGPFALRRVAVSADGCVVEQSVGVECADAVIKMLTRLRCDDITFVNTGEVDVFN